MPSGVKRPWEHRSSHCDSENDSESKRRKDSSHYRDRRSSHVERSSRLDRSPRHRNGDSYRKDRDHHRRSRSRHRDQDYDRHRERDRDKDRDRTRDRDRDRDRHRDSSRDRHRHRDKDRARRRDDDRRSDKRRSSREKPRHNGVDDKPKVEPPVQPPPPDHVSEKEEGEITPTPSIKISPSPPSRTLSRSPSRSRSRSYSRGRRTRSSSRSDSRSRSRSFRSRTRSQSSLIRKPLPEVKVAEPEPEPELSLAESPPSPEVLLARKRAQREAILAKYKATENGVQSTPLGTPLMGSGNSSIAVQPPPSTTTSITDIPTSSQKPAVTVSEEAKVADGGRSPSGSPEPHDAFSLAKDGDKEDGDGRSANGANAVSHPDEQVSAADYDPNVDRRQEEARRVRAMAIQQSKGSEVMDIDLEMGEEDKRDGGEKQEGEEVEEDEEGDDDDDMFDMFAAADDAPKKKKKKKVKVSKEMPSAPALITTTLDAAADPEGYYQVILGEQLDGGRYQVYSSLGKGMFSNVVRARVINADVGEAGNDVAIKIVRAQESMYKAGLKEIQILNKLKQADPDDKRHLIRLERTFEHRGHLCLVFESMSMNLREIVKRFGKDVGLNIKAVRAYAHQMFLALSLLRKLNIMHADIKPDNILVNESKSVLKLCDLGSASDVSENEITPYLVSRFYRAPEIILGLPYDMSIDIWSIGCTLYELYTGKILFPGRSNNQMLLHMMELKGRFNSKMIKKAQFGSAYFDEMGGFESIEQDKVTGMDIERKVHISKPVRDLRARLMPSTGALKEDEAKTLTSFIDLLDKCLALDPARRCTPKEALLHPFVRG